MDHAGAQARQITPLMLMPMSEWTMTRCDDGSDRFGVGIYARVQPDGSYCREWVQIPWACLPNNVIGVGDMERCGVLDDYLADLDGPSR